MFVYLHYNGGEPDWARSLRETGIPCHSPAFPLANQLQENSALSEELEGKKPAVRAYEHAEAFQLDETLWKPLSEVKESLVGADYLVSTDLLVWRDQWLLSRADVVLVENGATLEIPVIAALWGIPVVAVSFSPTGMQPWLAKCAQITLNSPTSPEQILASIGVQIVSEEPESLSEESQTMDSQGVIS